ncbi:hypothetical protein H257_09469 [Aphanomyces astaci]|uniref:Uncharacterized protein n=1 Tax=Aphanomyces astaci TaxID=112090 RepID=W4GBJ9_APHAT|nr:hypothetical protein H257_09469 [Aphanomyces astaci]ETV76449.1 hypothetical protein H257_09469 [Aphanomyces astaci]|eukprot:XP_009833994.1 hypothetical protein H257_09469 [Aphanomyces astaci]
MFGVGMMLRCVFENVNDHRQIQSSAYQPSYFGPGEVMHGLDERSPGSARNVLRHVYARVKWVAVTVAHIDGLHVGYSWAMTSRTLRRAVAVPRPNACRGWVKEDAPYNAEICAQTKLQVLNVYANESPVASNAYVGQPGWFT